MKVILLQNVAKVGQAGQIKDVTDGYALNFLVPNKLAAKYGSQVATKVLIKKESAIRQKVKQNSEVDKMFNKLSGKKLEIKSKANDQGHLYQAVHLKDVISLINKKFHYPLTEKNFVEQHGWKQLGTWPIKLSHHDRIIEFTLIISQE